MKYLLIDYDNGSHIHFFPQHTAYLAAALRTAGHKVMVWMGDIYRRPMEDLTDTIEHELPDVVGFGFIAGYYQYAVAKQIAAAVNNAINRKQFCFILGGHGPSSAPQFFINKLEANKVIVGEGEFRLPLSPASLPNICEGVQWPEIDDYPWPAYDLFPIDYYAAIRWPTSKNTDRCMPVLSGRGCKWKCSFCYRMLEGFRPRSPEAVLEEINFLIEKYNITHFNFSDELFMSSEKRIMEFCEKILTNKYKFKFDCNGRLNYAKPEILKLMKQAGAEYLNYGIESLDQKLLNEMGKGLTLNQIYNGVEATLAAGLSPGLNLIWGFPGDSEKNLMSMVKFINKYNPGDELRTIRPVTPYPGSRLFQEALDKGLVKDVEDFYENKCKNSDLISVNFMDIPTEEAHRMLNVANVKLIREYYYTRLAGTENAARKLYRFNDCSFRGFRSV